MDLIGKRFGLWVVVRLGRTPRKTQGPYWECRCDCGTVGEVAQARLTRERSPSRSCGCNRVAAITAKNTRHGHFANRHASPEYDAWRNMIGRCERPNRKDYKDWGGRGIKVCDKWRRFEDFLADVGYRPSPELTLDRIDTDGDYEPGNVRWATRSEQRVNQRRNNPS